MMMDEFGYVLLTVVVFAAAIAVLGAPLWAVVGFACLFLMASS